MEPKARRIIILIIVLLTIVLISILSYEYIFKKDEDTKIKTENNEKALVVYSNENDEICLEMTNECTKKLIEIETEGNAKLLDASTDSKYILYKDSKLKLYDLENKNESLLELEGYDKYQLHYDKDSKKVLGIIYYKDKSTSVNGAEYMTVGYYNVDKKVKMYDDVYDSLKILNNSLLVGQVDGDNKKVALLDIVDEKEVLSNNDTCGSYQMVSSGKEYYITETSNCDSPVTNIYNGKLKLLQENLENGIWSIDDKGYLYVVRNAQVRKYNNKGQAVSASNKYSDIKQVIKEYIVYEENGNLKISNENGLDLNITVLGENDTYDVQSSGYYEENKKEKLKSGIYMTVIKDDVSIRYYLDEESKQVEELDNN